MDRQPTKNRIVDYQMPGGETRPAIITRVNDDSTCNLHVFTDGANEGGIAPHQRQVAQGEEAGNWNWPAIAVPAGVTAPLAEMKAAA